MFEKAVHGSSCLCSVRNISSHVGALCIYTLHMNIRLPIQNFYEVFFISVPYGIAFYQSKCRYLRNILLTILVNIRILYETIDIKAVLGLIPLAAI